MSTSLPAINACFNAAASVLLVVGLVLIKRGRAEAHARVMVAAFALSACFLAGYLYYHFVVIPELGHTKFNREGLVRIAYYAMLLTHVVLAAVNLPMILRTFWLAHRGDLERHRKWARVTWPIWFYVSVTGVLVYLCLYHWNPEAPA